MNSSQKTTHARNAFTLVEMIIVIGIIALLAALTLGISSSVMRNSEIRKTEDVLKLMTMALQEWELERGRQITFEGFVPVENGMYDVWTNGEYVGSPSIGEDGF
ncbi:prepilin-type N-terminal cleavage/methylation domain-containing protein, partial [bacterium]|nr:prepilin-type N-terminal cleavage/methylation domain-containing protein [bacterium]